MAKNLLIVESPAKSRTLKKFLGKNFDVQATVGHISDLPKSKLGVDVENDFKPDYVMIRGKSPVIKKLKEAAAKADVVFLGPDPDREGEAIAWHVAEKLRNHKKMVRVTFNEITKSAVKDALEHTREIDINLVNAQQARRILDRLVGYKVSPFLWKTITGGLSAGRVQSVALRIICEREEEILAFIATEYWTIDALLADKAQTEFRSRLSKIEGEKPQIDNQIKADGICHELRQSEFIVEAIKKSQKKRNPPPPFITSTLQQEAAKAFYFSPKKTMMIAQQLYEGVDLGEEGPTGLITYMRTDSVRVAETAVTAVRDYIKDAYGADYLPKEPNRYKSRKGVQDAHEAIRPSYLDHAPDSLKKYLTRDQLKLYSLIWNRFLACQMSPAVYDTTSIIIKAGKYQFNSGAQALKFDGFLKVYQEYVENGNGNGESEILLDKLPDLKEGDKLTLKDLFPEQHFTKPPARFSQASLVKTLEAEGIGRPSTYATILSTLNDRKYVEIKERRLFPTDLGKTVNKILVENFPDVFDVKFTAGMEANLDQVESGAEDWVNVLREFYKPFSSRLEGLADKQSDIKDSLTEKTEEICEKCGSPMVIKWGRNGRFLACSAYPNCRNTKPLENAGETVHVDEKCPKCGSPMIIRSGRFGKFIACSNYPECKTTKSISTGVKCPKEGCSGDVVEKRSRKGKVFFGCSRYPDCDFVSWYKPVPTACPACGHPFLTERYSQAKGSYLACPSCKYQKTSEQEEEPVEVSDKG